MKNNVETCRDFLKCLLYRRGCEAGDPVDYAGYSPGYYLDCRWACCKDGLRVAGFMLHRPKSRQVMDVNGIDLIVAPFETQHKKQGRFVVIEPVDFRGRIVLQLRDGRRIFSPQRVK